MQRVNLTHELKRLAVVGLRLVIKSRPLQIQQFALAAYLQGMGAVNHRFALGNPAKPPARSKKSTSKVNCPILACKSFTSSSDTAPTGSLPKLAAMLSIACWRHREIWFACTSNCSDNYARVLSPRSAAKTTLALKSAVLFLLGRLIITLLDALRQKDQ